MSEPTLILTGISGATKVVTKLYGPVSPEREAQERAITQRRAESLNPAKPERRLERVREDEDYDE